jgi:hypothetical protein
MLKNTPVGMGNGKEYLYEFSHQDGKNVPIVSTYAQARGTFDSALTAIGTTVIAEAPGNSGLVLTDLLVSSEKKASATINVQFYDGTNTESIMLISLTDAPVNFGVPLAGRWLAWQGADLQIVCSHTAVGCVAVGYYRTNEASTLSYDAWIERR